MVAAEHQILSIDHDREIAVMLVQRHLPSVRGPGGSYFHSRFHDSIL
jgi:hypothetical protein